MGSLFLPGESDARRLISRGEVDAVAVWRIAGAPENAEGLVILADGTPLPADATTYSVTTVDFMVYGGDGFGDLFRPISAVVRGPYVEDVIATFQADLAAGDVTALPAPDGRITVVR
jgi:hypothetical protein